MIYLIPGESQVVVMGDNGRQFVFVVLMKAGAAIVKGNGAAKLKVHDGRLREALGFDEVRIMATERIPEIAERLLTIGVATGRDAVQTIGDYHSFHLAMMLADDADSVFDIGRQYIERFRLGSSAELFEDYLLLTESQYISFSRIDDPNSCGLAIAKHPTREGQNILKLFITDRGLAQIESQGTQVIATGDLAAAIGAKFTHVVVAKNLRYAKAATQVSGRDVMAMSLPRHVGQIPYNVNYYAMGIDMAVCLVRLAHSDAIKAKA